jgi:hypothetical protein
LFSFYAELLQGAVLRHGSLPIRVRVKQLHRRGGVHIVRVQLQRNLLFGIVKLRRVVAVSCCRHVYDRLMLLRRAVLQGQLYLRVFVHLLRRGHL